MFFTSFFFSCDLQSIWRKLLVLSWLYDRTPKSWIKINGLSFISLNKQPSHFFIVSGMLYNMFMTCFHEFRIYESTNFFHEFFIVFFKRAIFQTFWKLHCCAKSLFFELETSNCGYLLFFKFSLTIQSSRKIEQTLY